jgi:hypothetical protein
MLTDVRSIVRRILAGYPRLYRRARLVFRWHRARTSGYADWDEFLSGEREWPRTLAQARGGERVLLATSLGAELVAVRMESLLGVALAARGAEPHVLLCDEALPACQLCTVDWYPAQERFVASGPKHDLCRSCYWPAEKLFSRLGFTIHRYSSYLTSQDHALAAGTAAALPMDEISGYRLDGLAVGEHALAGALRFFARGTIDREPHGEAVLRRYFRAAILTSLASRRLVMSLRPVCTVMHHGIYVPQGLLGEAVRAAGLRAAVWNVAYRRRRFLFSHHDTYHHTLISEPMAAWEDLRLSTQQEERLLGYLGTRLTGSSDWISFQAARPETDGARIAEQIGIDPSRPCVGLLTNVVWDAQLHYRANAFPDMLAWLRATIEYFEKRPDLQLIVRVHPAEIKGAIPSRQKAVDEIYGWYPALPSNVFVIPPESPLSTYRAMELCDCVLIYGTKTGVELSAVGVPVVVAGEAWIRGKGVSIDMTSPQAYRELLDSLPLGKRLTQSQRERAMRYAFHFFFRRMIPLNLIEETSGWPPFRMRVTRLDQVRPGSSLGLDVIVNGILSGSEFVYPAEREGAEE